MTRGKANDRAAASRELDSASLHEIGRGQSAGDDEACTDGVASIKCTRRRDRVVQAAVLLILEPIFEADFEDCSYGFRPGRSAHDALRQILSHLKAGQTAVYNADLAGYFDRIPHDKLIACLRMRVVDGSVLGLIRQWLDAPVVEPPKDRHPPGVQRNDLGTPQGGVLSPLLANVYLHWFDHVVHRREGPGQWTKAKSVRYADEFVVLAREREALRA